MGDLVQTYVEWSVWSLTTWVPWVLLVIVVLWIIGIVDNRVRRYNVVVGPGTGSTVDEETERWLDGDSHRHLHWDDAADDWRRCEARHY